MTKASNQASAIISNKSEKNLLPAEVSVDKNQKLNATNNGLGALTNINSKLTDRELGNKGTMKLLVDRVRTLESEQKRLSLLNIRFNQLKTENAVLQKEVKLEKKYKILSQICLALGGLVGGLSASPKDLMFKLTLLCFGFILIIIASVLSYLSYKNA